MLDVGRWVTLTVCVHMCVDAWAGVGRYDRYASGGALC